MLAGMLVGVRVDLKEYLMVEWMVAWWAEHLAVTMVEKLAVWMVVQWEFVRAAKMVELLVVMKAGP